MALVLRDEDIEEIHVGTGSSPYDVIVDSVNKSDEAYYASYNDEPLAVWGIRRESLLSEGAKIWLLCADTIVRHKKMFWKICKQDIDIWKSEYSYLYNFIYHKNKSTKRWLKRLDFWIDPKINEIGFQRFEWRKICADYQP